MRRSKPIDIDILNSGYRYALSLCSNRQDAEDIVHDAWVRLDNRYKKPPEKSLLYTTIRNLYIDRYRRAMKIRFSEFEEHIYVPDANAFDGITADELDRFLRQLRDVEREALYLSVVEGYTADEISTMTSTARGTVLSMIHRARIKLRNWMAGEDIHSVNGITSPDVIPAKAEVIELAARGKSK